MNPQMKIEVTYRKVRTPLWLLLKIKLKVLRARLSNWLKKNITI
jgi:hypothetical protein